MATVEQHVNTSSKVTFDLDRWCPNTSYRCHVALIQEEDGSFSAVVLNLPGTGSCGETLEEAISNAREAIAGVIKSYRSRNLEIPWTSDYLVPDKAAQKWILVDA